MVSVDWNAYEGDRPAYFNPYGLGYPVGSPASWINGGNAEWPAGSGPEIGKIVVFGSDDLSTYDPATDKLVFGFRTDDGGVSEMGAHNYCVLWEEQPDGNYTLSVMPVSIWESQEPIGSIPDIDPADLSTLIQSWAATNNHFQDDLVASVYSIDPTSTFPDNQIVVQTGVAGETTTYDFAAMRAAHGEDIVLNFTTFTGREMRIEYDDAANQMTISHFGESWGGYNDVWGKTVITNVGPDDLIGLDQLWRYDSALEDGRLQKDRFNGFLNDLSDGGDGAPADPNLVLTIDGTSQGMDHVHLHGDDDYIQVDVDADDFSAFVDDNGHLNLKVDSTGFVVMVMEPAAQDLVDTLADHLKFSDSNARAEVQETLAALSDTGGDTGGSDGGDTGTGTAPDPADGELLYAANNGDLSYEVRSSWAGGFVADLGFTPESSVGNWQIAFTLDAEITNIWNGRIVSHEGDRYVIENESYNGALSGGQEAGFGFQASGNAVALSNVTLNGVAASYDGGGEPEPEPEPVIPDVSIQDVTVVENAGSAAFAVRLSEAVDHDVAVTYETFAGTAEAGVDFVAGSGSVIIPAGAQEAAIVVDLVDDTTVEASESFTVRLTSAEGGTIADATATGTIENDDVAPPTPPELSVSVGGPVSEGGHGGGGTATIADGPFSTSGNAIVDSAGNEVEIHAVNWFGLETTLSAPHGLWARNWQDMMDQMQDQGFNAIRLPFSGELVATGGSPSGIDFSKNPDLVGLNGLEIMDKIVGYADEIGMKILLDHHRVDAGDGAQASGLWYTDEYSAQDWIDHWTTLAERYADTDAVIGADLHNEPHGPATWGGGGPTDWAAAAEAAGNAIHAVNLDWLIVVEGVGDYQGDNYWWGGNLQGVADRPVDLDQDNKVVYSPHDYPQSVYDQPWFTDGSDLSQVFSDHWGYIHEQEIAPILLGEFGSKLETSVDQAWADAIVQYLGGDYDLDGTSDLGAGESAMSWAWWSWNPNSGDTGGILEDDWTTVRQNAVNQLQPLIEADNGDPSGPASVTFTVSIDQAQEEAVTVSYETVDGTALAGSDYEATSGDLEFAPGETEKTVTVTLVDDDVQEGTESFSLKISNPFGDDLVTEATITDDEDGGEPGPVDPPVEDSELSFELALVNDWGSGAQYQVSISNDGDAAIDAWHLGIDLPFEITQLWNGTIVESEDGRYEIENAAWNGEIAPGQTITFGFLTDEGNFDLDALLSDADPELLSV
ncbi:cellulase family glycosylhydrolase [Amorphus sp. 3PC139-8]|uniref:cellulase family glycosylhydrolase n=1 Tax=Amorphus sp. 3PC139-8 TaxID=2735676 RepID=UPI00345D13DD